MVLQGWRALSNHRTEVCGGLVEYSRMLLEKEQVTLNNITIPQELETVHLELTGISRLHEMLKRKFSQEDSYLHGCGSIR